METGLTHFLEATEVKDTAGGGVFPNFVEESLKSFFPAGWDGQPKC